MIGLRDKYFGFLKKARSSNILIEILKGKRQSLFARTLGWILIAALAGSGTLGVITVQQENKLYGVSFAGIVIFSLALHLFSRYFLLQPEKNGKKSIKWHSMDDRCYSIFAKYIENGDEEQEELQKLKQWLEASQLAKPKILIYSFIGIAAYFLAPIYSAAIRDVWDVNPAKSIMFATILISLCSIFFNTIELLLDRKHIETAGLHRYISMYLIEKGVMN